MRISLLSVLSVLITCVLLFAAVRLITRVTSHIIQRSTGFDATQKLLTQKLAAIVW